MEDQLKQQMLDMLLGSLTDEAKKFATEEISKIKQLVQADLADMKTNAEKIKKEVDVILNNSPTVVNLGSVEKPDKQLTHSSFDKIIKVLGSAKRKEKNIMLVGGAGGGKTHLVKQIADALKLPFYPMSVGMQTTKSDLLGFINATGGYVPSCVRKAYEDGGVLLLDEFDAAHAGVVTILNSLLANGHCSFPDKIVNKHKDFICIVACNTYGNGANLEYIGRNRLDGATLDRFIIIDVDYDSKLEGGLTKNNKWYKVVKKIRKNAEANGIKIIISPRACMDGADLLDAGFKVQEVIDMTIIKGNSEDVKKKLLKGVSFEDFEFSDMGVTDVEDSSEQTERNCVLEFSIYEDGNKCVVDKPSPDTKDGSISAGGTKVQICFSDWYGKSGIENTRDKVFYFNSKDSQEITRNGHFYREVKDLFDSITGLIFHDTFNLGESVKFNFIDSDGTKTIYEYQCNDGKFRKTIEE